ncbi:MAG: hypothetical protein IKK28_13240 [Mogibacterium sp.]|nr:hypothetical protein [Mogibacterium sp.]
MGNFRNKLMAFMYGRYGVDELYYALFAVCMVIAVINMFINSLPLYLIGLLSIIFMMFRSFSRKHDKRRRENMIFLKMWNPVKSWFILQKDRMKDRKTARYRRCTGCKAMIRLPNKKGTHTVKCPKCGERFGVHIF